jgi:WhiB family redox-sensing transcriptional regulator
MYRNHNDRWREHAKCRDHPDPGMWFPPKGSKGGSIEAQRICASCPVKGDCLSHAVLRPEGYGIWAGAGERPRRLLRRLQAACPHPDRGIMFECPCEFCAEAALHFQRLDVLAETGRGPSPARPTYGPGATHGRRSTAKRGCGCAPCKAALRPDYERAS